MEEYSKLSEVLVSCWFETSEKNVIFSSFFFNMFMLYIDKVF